MRRDDETVEDTEGGSCKRERGMTAKTDHQDEIAPVLAEANPCPAFSSKRLDGGKASSEDCHACVHPDTIWACWRGGSPELAN